MGLCLDYNNIGRTLAANLSDLIILTFAIVCVVVFELSLDLHSAKTRPCPL